MRSRSSRAVFALVGLAVAGVAATDALGGKPAPSPPPPADPAIAYSTSPFSGSTASNLMVMNADGSNQRVVVQARKSGPVDIQPDWSPDGTQIVFVSTSSGPGIYVVNLDGTGLHKIVSTYSVAAVHPAWSPAPVPGVGGNRHRIAYTDTGVGGDYDVWLVDVDGSNPVNVTSTSDAERYPTWSPSGTKLACAVINGAGTVWDRYGVVDFTTGQYAVAAYPAPLAGHMVERPSWAKSRDDRMAVEANTTWPASGGAFDIWLVNPLDATFAPVQLTATASVSEMNPNWSPDDSRIAFDSYQTAGVEVMNADGSNRHSLAKPGVQPAWRRNP